MPRKCPECGFDLRERDGVTMECLVCTGGGEGGYAKRSRPTPSPSIPKPPEPSGEPHHSLSGNCWDDVPVRDGYIIDFCEEHDEPRGRCSACPPCPLCRGD